MKHLLEVFILFGVVLLVGTGMYFYHQRTVSQLIDTHQHERDSLDLELRLSDVIRAQEARYRDSLEKQNVHSLYRFDSLRLMSARRETRLRRDLERSNVMTVKELQNEMDSIWLESLELNDR